MREGFGGGYEEEFGGSMEHDPEKKEIDKKSRERQLWREYEAAATPLERLRCLEIIISSIVEGSESALTREIAQKFLEKMAFKREIESMTIHGDDPQVYSRMKKLGLFIVIDRRSEHAMKSVDRDLDIEVGDELLDLHLPPVDEATRENLFAEATRSFKLIAQYMEIHNLHPKYIIGITYNALARAARRYGFASKRIDLPAELVQPVERVYAESERGKRGDQLEHVAIIYQTGEAFTERFADEEEPTETGDHK